MDIIPLNFLQHVDEDKIHKSYQYCTASLYHRNVVNTNTSTIKRCGRPPKSTIQKQKQDKNAKSNGTPPKQAITRQKQTDKTVNNNTASIIKTNINPLHPGLCDSPNTINLDNINRELKKTMAINPDLSEPNSSKLLTT